MALKGFKVSRPRIPDVMSPTGKLRAAESKIEFLESKIKAIESGGGSEGLGAGIKEFAKFFGMDKAALLLMGAGGLSKDSKDRILSRIFNEKFKNVL